MDRTCSFLAGLGLGAGLMYAFDPQMGRRRRALARDQAVHMAHEAQDAAGVVAKDVRNRAQGLAAGDVSVLTGQRGWQGGWSPSARALMGIVGGGLFLYGLTQRAPTACLLGCGGLALAAEAVSNARPQDIARLPQKVAEAASDVAGNLGFGARTAGVRQPAHAGA